MAKVAFIQNIAYEYVGTGYLAGVLKKEGHRVELFLNNNIKGLIKELASFSPDLTAFSCTTGIHRRALDLAKRVKASLPVLTIFGGPHPTFLPEIINDKGVDIVCIGEGELAIAELADRLDSKKDFSDIENLWIKESNGRLVKNPLRPLIQDLDKLPFPDRSIYYHKYPSLNHSQKAFFAGRGCLFDCTFCFNHALKDIYKDKGSFIRLRSQRNLIEEIKIVRDNFGLRTVYLQDDTILSNKVWFMEFLKIYKKEIDLPFVCLVRADLMDEEIVGELKKSNCHSVFFGIETGDEELRNRLLKKNIKDTQLIEAARLLKKYKIKFRTYNIIGLPGEELCQAFKTVELNIKIKTDYPWCSLYFPYPGTELGEIARSENLIEKEWDRINSSFFYRSIIRSEYKKELSNLQKFFFYAVKIPWAFPLIKRVIKIKESILFDLAFLFSYTINYLKSENLTPKDLFNIARYNIRVFFFR